MKNHPPRIVYLAYKFSRDPTKNTQEARTMALELMKRHNDWFIIVPHYAVDALLDGTLDWKGQESNFDEWRRTKAGMMCLAFLTKADIVILGCEPVYEKSSGVTWEYTFLQMLNQSYRRKHPIKVLTFEEAMR